jgi:hypothetical protein
MNPSPIPRVLNLAEAAKFVRCSRSHLSNVLNSKVRDVPHLPAVRIGRRVLFRQNPSNSGSARLKLRKRKSGDFGLEKLVVRSESAQKIALKTPERTNVRRKRFQRGCLRKIKHGRLWVWIGKYYEDGRGRSKVLGHCAQMTEGAAWARLQEFLNPINETAGFRQTLPTDFMEYVMNVFLPQRRKKWKDSTDKTTTERYQAYLVPAFDDRQLRDLTRDQLQRFLDIKTKDGLSKSVVSHLRWDLNAVFKMAANDGLIQGNPAGSLVTPKEAKTFEKRTMTKEEIHLALSVLDLRERVVFLLAVWLECALARSLHSDGVGSGRTWSTSWNGYTAGYRAIRRQSEENEWLRFHLIWPRISSNGVRLPSTSDRSRWCFRRSAGPSCRATIFCGGTSITSWRRLNWGG